jgi:hypothetical protein
MGRKKSATEDVQTPFENFNLSEAMRKTIEALGASATKEQAIDYWELNFKEAWKTYQAEKRPSWDSSLSKARKEAGGGLRTRRSGTKQADHYSPTIADLLTVAEEKKTLSIDDGVLKAVRDLARKVGGLENLQQCLDALEKLQVYKK